MQPVQPMQPFRSHAARSLLLLGAGGLAGLLVVELLVRWVVPADAIYSHPAFEVEAPLRPSEAEAVDDPLLGPAVRRVDAAWRYALRPGLRGHFSSSEFRTSFETNEHGLRGPSPGHGRGPRILGLGDSFAMGFGVEIEETYLFVLADRMTRAGLPAEPIDAGVLGYNAANSLAYLAGPGLALEPAVVILQLWAGDDLCTGGEAAAPRVPRRDLVGRSKRLLGSLQLGILLRERLRRIAPLRAWLMDRGWLDRGGVAALLATDLPETCARGLATLEADFAELRRLSLENDFRAMVLLIPLREQIYAADLERALAYEGADSGAISIDRDAPGRAVAAAAARQGVAVLDATAALREAIAGARLYFERVDPHLTPRGHAVVAAALDAHLNRRGATQEPDHLP